MINIDDSIIESEYKNQIEEFKRNLNNDHVLLLSPDNEILINIISYLTNTFTKKNNIRIFKKSIKVTSISQNVQENSLYLINMDDKNEKELMKILYFYLEKKKIIFLIIYSSRIDCVDRMEKRVRSRFNNNCILFPYLSLETFKIVLKNELKIRILNNESNFYNNYDFKIFEKAKLTEIKNFKINKPKNKRKGKCYKAIKQRTSNSLEKEEIKNAFLENILAESEHLKNIYDFRLKNIENISFLIANKLSRFKMDMIYKLLTPIHIAILILSTKSKLQIKNIVSKFRIFVSGVREIGMVGNNDLINAFIDCKKMGFIEKSTFYGDQIGFIDFVKTNSPFYLRNLLNIKKKI